MTVRAEEQITLSRVNDGDNGVKVYDGTAGSVVTVSNASEYPALELVADIIPIQPNDYDSVWFGGAGKNVCVPFEGTKYGIVRTVNDDGTVSITGTATAASWAYLEEYYDLPYCGIDVGDTISIYSDVYIAVMAYNGTTSLGSKTSKDGVATTYTIPANTTRLRIIQYPKSTTPASGETFDTTARYWVSKSSFSAWEPYENICPIYGHDHCTITRKGKNLITMDPSALASYSSNDITWTKIDGNTIHVQGTASAQSNCALTSDWGKLFHAVLPAGTYRATTDSDVRLRVGTGPNNTNKGNAYGGFSFTISESTDVWLGLFVSNGTTINKDVTVQLEKGSTATTFEPYKGIEYTTDFPQTVYGGTLDVVNGVLTVTHKCITLDGTEADWRISGSTANNQYILSSVPDIVLSGSLGHIISDRLPEITGATGYQNNNINGIAVWTDPQIRVSLDISIVNRSVADFKTWLSNNNLQVVYELATPIVYSVSPKDIELISGTCNVWATTGDITDFRYAEIAPATLETFGDARKVAVKYVTDMGDDGIIVHPENDTSNYAKINAEGMDIVVDDESVASYGRTARIGAEESSRIEIMPDVFSVVSPEGIEPFRVETGDVVTSEQKIRKYISKVIPKNTTYDIELSEILSPITTGTSFTFEGFVYVPGSVNISVKQAFVKGTSATYTVSNITLAYNATSQILTVTNSAGLDFLISNIWYYAYVRNSKIYLLSDLLADFVIDEGFDLSTTWRYCKWHSGKVEAWYHDQTYVDSWQTKINTSANGGFYISENLDVPDFPDGLFSSSGTIQRFATAASEDNYFVQCLIKDNAGWADNTNFGDVYWATTSARSSLHNYYIDLYAVQFPPNN